MSWVPAGGRGGGGRESERDGGGGSLGGTGTPRQPAAATGRGLQGGGVAGCVDGGMTGGVVTYLSGPGGGRRGSAQGRK